MTPGGLPAANQKTLVLMNEAQWRQLVTLKAVNIPFIVVTVLVIKILLCDMQLTLKLILELKKE